jgi:prophage regulatory protein
MRRSTAMSQRLLRLSQVIDKTGYSGASIWRLVRAGRFPKPVKLVGSRAVAWLEDEIDALIDKARAAR